ncbi:MAG: hypothetical protein KKC20_11705 [Proteobacteria bacterium]|nr:hypothetical protein [Pseudomonadota bacterium]
MADTHTMVVVAEVHETDISKIRYNQGAVIKSRACQGRPAAGVGRTGPTIRTS